MICERYQPSASQISIRFAPGRSSSATGIGLEGDALVVAGPARGQQVVADPPAVDEAAVEPERRDARGSRRRAPRRGRSRARRSSPACPRPGRRAGGSSTAVQRCRRLPRQRSDVSSFQVLQHQGSPPRVRLSRPRVSVYNDLREPLYTTELIRANGNFKPGCHSRRGDQRNGDAAASGRRREAERLGRSARIHPRG